MLKVSGSRALAAKWKLPYKQGKYSQYGAQRNITMNQGPAVEGVD